MVEYEDFITPYEFEERADLFMSEVEEISEDFPELLIETKNRTIDDLEVNAWAIGRFKKPKAVKNHNKFFLLGHRLEIESANEMVTTVIVQGNNRKQVRRFEKVVEETAKCYRGIRTDSNKIKDSGAYDELRFGLSLTYNFR